MRFVLGLFGFLLIGVCSISTAEVGVTPTEIVLGSCAALQGPAKDAGSAVVEGGKLYFDWVNGNGGVNGRKIRLISDNDDYEPDHAVTCFQGLLDKNILAGTLFYGSPPSAKHSAMAQSHKIPAVGFASGSDFLYGPDKHYLFNVRANIADETTAAALHVLDDLKARKIGEIYQDDAGGVGFWNGVNRVLEKRGVSPAAIGTIKRNSTDVEEAVQTVRKADPDVVFLLGNFAPTVAVLKRANELGWKPLFIAIGPRDALLKAGPAVEGVVISQVVPPPERTDLKAIELYHRALKKYDQKTKPNFYGLEGFLNAIVIVEGLKRAGSNPTRASLIAALETLSDWDLGLGDMKLHFKPGDHHGLDQAFFTIARGGRLELVEDWKRLRRASESLSRP